MKKWKRTNRKIMSFLSVFAMMLSVLLVPDIGSVKATGTTGTDGQVHLAGRAHVQTYGNVKSKTTIKNGVETLVLGTRGQAKRMEAILISMKNNTGYEGGMQYRVHRQTYGWTNWIDAGKTAGTTGQSKRLEAIEIRLTGEISYYYSVRYRAHIQTYGDNQGWVYNGALAGTTGEAKRIEEIQVQIVPKAAFKPDTVMEPPMVSYRVHRQTTGWEKTWAKNGATAGTCGQAKRLEAISITLNNNYGVYDGGIKYRTYVQSYRWLDWVQDGEMSGTQGQAKRLEAIAIELYGGISNVYDVYYRVHMQSMGWLKWVKNGAYSGSIECAKRLEAIQIKLVRKGDPAPSDADVGNPKYGFLWNSDYYDVLAERIAAKSYSGLGNEITAYAAQFIGTPYVWGGADLRAGVDCSGFTMKVYEAFGYQLGHLVSLQYKAGREVPLMDTQPGDLFIYKTPDKKDFWHVEMYYGGGKVIGSAGGGVQIKHMFYFGLPDYVVRLIP